MDIVTLATVIGAAAGAAAASAASVRHAIGKTPSNAPGERPADGSEPTVMSRLSELIKGLDALQSDIRTVKEDLSEEMRSFREQVATAERETAGSIGRVEGQLIGIGRRTRDIEQTIDRHEARLADHGNRLGLEVRERDRRPTPIATQAPRHGS